MTAVTTVSLADLVEARCQTDTAILTYRDNIPSRPAKNYVVLLFSAGITYGERIVGTADTLLWRFRALCVGYSGEETLWVADRIRALFTNWRPMPENLAVGWFTEEQDDAPLLRDESMINDVRYSLTLRFRITTPRSI